MKNKKLISVISLYAIILITFNVIYFFIPFPKRAAAWVCYGFSTFAIILSCVLSFVAFLKDKSLKSKIYGYPIYKGIVTYLSAQFAFTITILSLGFAVNVPAWIPVIVSVVDLAYILKIFIVTVNARDIIQSQEDDVRQATQQMTLFKVDMSSIVDMCKNAELKKSLSKLLDDFKYSDPVSSPQLEECEKIINIEVENLRYLVNVDDEAAQEKVVLLTQLLADRNRRCKAFKQ
ncbi:MAG: hypothetical protein ACI4WG_03220 [Erysipelotrichaceae bacterium]